eukprot:760510-Pyramimonas_sp.AAC.1
MLGAELDKGLGLRPVAVLDDCPRLGLVEDGAHGASSSLGLGCAAQAGIGGPPNSAVHWCRAHPKSP